MIRKLLLSVFFMIIISFTSGCYLISHWGDEPNSSSSGSSSSSSIAVTYTVTFDSQGGTAVNPTSITITLPSITVGTLPAAPSRTGYNFVGWYTATNGGGTQFTSSTTVNTNIIVYAYWSTNPVYTVI